MPGSAIRKRAATRGAGPVWRSWPLEMASKTAIKWACARGFVPVESIELDQALAADTRAEMAPTPEPIEVPRVAMPLPSDVFAPPPEPETVEAEIIDDPGALDDGP